MPEKGMEALGSAVTGGSELLDVGVGNQTYVCVRIVQDCNCRVFSPVPSIFNCPVYFLVRFVFKH